MCETSGKQFAHRRRIRQAHAQFRGALQRDVQILVVQFDAKPRLETPLEQIAADFAQPPTPAEMDQALQMPGVTNAWTMPIKARLDMLTTGIRTPVGVKVYGKDLKVIEQLGRDFRASESDPRAAGHLWSTKA